MNTLKIKTKVDCRWDLVSLGEVLLRFDSGAARIDTARDFRVYDGGGEYNVARNLAKTFRLKTAITTALTGNALGRLAENLIGAGGVDNSEILWRDGGDARNGLYFIERGFGLRVPSSCFDREHTAVSQLKTGDLDWDRIFAESGARWFHTGGVFVGLSRTTPEVASEAMRKAQENNTIVSYDLNYRDSLWKTRGGREAANELNRKLLRFADIAFGAFEFDSKMSNYNEDDFRRAAGKMFADFPNLKAVASTVREVYSASRHDLSAVCCFENQIYKARDYHNIEDFDRVGSGDAFASGFIYGCLTNQGGQYSVECGAALGALTMTTPGDNAAASLAETEKLMAGGKSDAER